MILAMWLTVTLTNTEFMEDVLYMATQEDVGIVT